MTQAAIREAFANLRDDVQLPLEAAARSRAEADWLVGINGTRAMTAFNSKDGGFFKTPVGRVQTPRWPSWPSARNASAPSCRATTGRCAPSSWPPPACTKAAGSTRTSRRTSATRKARIAPVVASRRPERGGGLPRATRQRDRGIQALDPDVAGPVRPDLAAARGQRPLRLGQDHAGAGPDPVRTPQGADLPAYRLALPARGLPEHGQGNHARAGAGRLERRRRPGAPCRHRGRRGLGQAQSPHLRQQEGVGPLRHHPHAADPA